MVCMASDPRRHRLISQLHSDKPSFHPVMTDQQIDALIDRQIEQYESWLEELNEQHWQQELEELEDD